MWPVQQISIQNFDLFFREYSSKMKKYFFVSPVTIFVTVLSVCRHICVQVFIKSA